MKPLGMDSDSWAVCLDNGYKGHNGKWEQVFEEVEEGQVVTFDYHSSLTMRIDSGPFIELYKDLP